MGWNRTTKIHTVTWLAREVKQLVREKKVHAVGISEIFGARDTSTDQMTEKQQLLEQLLHEIRRAPLSSSV